MMNFKNTALLFLFGILPFSCKQQNKSAQTPQTESEKTALFAKGEKIENDDHFNGTVWVNSLITADSTNQNAVGNVVFEPGSRSTVVPNKIIKKEKPLCYRGSRGFIG